MLRTLFVALALTALCARAMDEAAEDNEAGLKLMEGYTSSSSKGSSYSEKDKTKIKGNPQVLIVKPQVKSAETVRREQVGAVKEKDMLIRQEVEKTLAQAEKEKAARKKMIEEETLRQLKDNEKNKKKLKKAAEKAAKNAESKPVKLDVVSNDGKKTTTTKLSIDAKKGKNKVTETLQVPADGKGTVLGTKAEKVTLLDSDGKPVKPAADGTIKGVEFAPDGSIRRLSEEEMRAKLEAQKLAAAKKPSEADGLTSLAVAQLDADGKAKVAEVAAAEAVKKAEKEKEGKKKLVLEEVDANSALPEGAIDLKAAGGLNALEGGANGVAEATEDGKPAEETPEQKLARELKRKNDEAEKAEDAKCAAVVPELEKLEKELESATRPESKPELEKKIEDAKRRQAACERRRKESCDGVGAELDKTKEELEKLSNAEPKVELELQKKLDELREKKKRCEEKKEELVEHTVYKRMDDWKFSECVSTSCHPGQPNNKAGVEGLKCKFIFWFLPNNTLARDEWYPIARCAPRYGRKDGDYCFHDNDCASLACDVRQRETDGFITGIYEGYTALTQAVPGEIWMRGVCGKTSEERRKEIEALELKRRSEEAKKARDLKIEHDVLENDAAIKAAKEKISACKTPLTRLEAETMYFRMTEWTTITEVTTTVVTEVHQIETRIETIEAQIAACKDKKERRILETELKRLRTEKKTVTKKMSRAEEVATKAMTLQQRIDDVKLRLEKSSNSIEVEALQKELASLKEKKKLEDNAAKRVEKELSKKKHRIETTQQRLDRLKLELEKAQSPEQAAAIAKKIEACKLEAAEVAKKTKKLSESTIKMSSSSSSSSSSSKEAKALREKLDRLKLEYEKASTNAAQSSIKKQMEQARKQLAEVEKRDKANAAAKGTVKGVKANPDGSISRTKKGSKKAADAGDKKEKKTKTKTTSTTSGIKFNADGSIDRKKKTDASAFKLNGGASFKLNSGSNFKLNSGSSFKLNGGNSALNTYGLKPLNVAYEQDDDDAFDASAAATADEQIEHFDDASQDADQGPAFDYEQQQSDDDDDDDDEMSSNVEQSMF